MMNFEDKLVVVTGASKGIGFECAKAFSAHGARTVLLARNQENLNLAVDKLSIQGGNVEGRVADVSDYGALKAIIGELEQDHGGIDILINNATVIEPLAFLAESDPVLWARAADINFKGVYFAMRAVLPNMIARNQGIIINMSSGAANSALAGWSHYCATKAAAKKLTETAHNEVQAHNVRIVGLSPGTVATDMMRKIHESKINSVSNLDWSTHISAEWVAKAVLFLSGEGGASYAGTDFSLKTDEGRKLIGLPGIGR